MHGVTGDNEFIEDAAHRGDLFGWTQRKRHALVLDAFLLPVRQDMQAMTAFIQEHPVEAIGRFAASPIALLRDPYAPVEHLGAQFLAVLGGAKALELHIDGVKGVVGAWHPERGVNHLFAMLLTFSAVRCRQIDILETSPTAHVQAEHKIKVFSLLDPAIHHLVEPIASFGSQAGFPAISEFLNNVNTVLIGPFLDQFLLDRHGVFLPVCAE